MAYEAAEVVSLVLCSAFWGEILTKIWCVTSSSGAMIVADMKALKRKNKGADNLLSTR